MRIAMQGRIQDFRLGGTVKISPSGANFFLGGGARPCYAHYLNLAVVKSYQLPIMHSVIDTYKI